MGLQYHPLVFSCGLPGVHNCSHNIHWTKQMQSKTCFPLQSYTCYKPSWPWKVSSNLFATLAPPIISSSLSARQRASRVGEGCSLLSHLNSKSLRKADGPVLSGEFWMTATCEVIPSWWAIGTQYGYKGWSNHFSLPRSSSLSWVSVNEIGKEQNLC